MSTPTQTVNLRNHLREQTKQAHQNAENAVGLNQWLEDRESYATYLGKLWDWHAAVEPTIVDALPPAARAFAKDRLPQLKADLEALGRNAEKPLKAYLKLETPEAAIGAWYVVLGSSMGGSIIAKAATKKLGDVPVSFLADPSIMREVWPAFAAYLSTFEDPTMFASAEAGANATFQSIQAHFSK